MNQLAISQGTACFSSWNHFENCYPKITQLIDYSQYYGCSFLTWVNHLTVYEPLVSNTSPNPFAYFQWSVFGGGTFKNF